MCLFECVYRTVPSTCTGEVHLGGGNKSHVIVGPTQLSPLHLTPLCLLPASSDERELVAIHKVNATLS